jgi:hypothetical protein
MITNKELDRKISDLVGDAKVYNIRSHEYQWEEVTVKELKVEDYSSNVDLAISAAKRIADKNNYTFVLTYLPETTEWRAAFGDYGDCAEYSGFNPAYCICITICKFMGKL